jgi:O-antigen ligase
VIKSKLAIATWTIGLAATLAWGVFAFGAVYPWAYGPLLIAIGLLGSIGLVLGGGPFPLGLAGALALLSVSVGAQLIPLPLPALQVLSPLGLATHLNLNLHFYSEPDRALPISIDPLRTRLGFSFLAVLTVFMLGSVRMLTRDLARSIAGWIATLGVVLALVGIVQRSTFDGRIYGFWELQQGGDPFGPFVNHNHFAGWILMGLALAGGLLASVFLRSHPPIGGSRRDCMLVLGSAGASRVVMLSFAVLAMVLSLVLSMSRSGMLAFVAATLLLIAAVGMRRRSLKASFRWSGYFAAAALTIVFVAGLERVASRFSASDTSSLGGRLQIWSQSLDIAREFWLTGTGLNTYGVSTLVYGKPYLGRHLQQAHNEYLQLAVEGGLLLAVPITIAIAAFIAAVRQRLREDGQSLSCVRLGAITGLVAIAIQSLVEFSLQMPANSALFCTLCAIAIHDGRRM